VLTCCNLYGNTNGDWIGCIADQEGSNGNISLDPLFCDAENGEFSLCSDSPCALDNNPGCGQIGALGTGCGDCGPLLEGPTIVRVEDVGNDQGRQVRIEWVRSLYDAPEDTVAISGYAIFRREDEGLACNMNFSDILPMAEAEYLLPALSGWDYLITVPAMGDSLYQCVVPTLCDSMPDTGICWSVFRIFALTPDPLVHFSSEPDSGYSLDNLAPSVPLGLSVAYNCSGGNELEWEECPEEDFQHFRIYRSESGDFTPGAGNLVHMTTVSGWRDEIFEGFRYYYKVTAVDFSGNESDAASPTSVTGDDTPDVPGEFTLYQNVPNPFNPVTTIRFDLPRSAHVSLVVYNVKGDLVATIVDRHMSAGRKEVIWDASNDCGISSASGVYFYRIVAGRFAETRKMVLMR
jgi:hypothetical protein